MSQYRIGFFAAFIISFSVPVFSQTLEVEQTAPDVSASANDCNSFVSDAEKACNVQVPNITTSDSTKSGGDGPEAEISQSAVMDRSLREVAAIQAKCIRIAFRCQSSCGKVADSAGQSGAVKCSGFAKTAENLGATKKKDLARVRDQSKSVEDLRKARPTDGETVAENDKKEKKDGMVGGLGRGRKDVGGRDGESGSGADLTSGLSRAVRDATNPTISSSARNDGRGFPRGEKSTIDKTPEQIRQERREAKIEARREERINAFAKTFESLNSKSMTGQAINESPATALSPAQSAVNNAPVTAGAVHPTEDKSKTKTDDDAPDLGRAGFNELAKKNLAVRKAMAASLGINGRAINAAAPSAFPQRPMAAKSGSTIGSQTASFSASGGTFAPSAGSASLDPIVDSPQPSDLPNFKLGAPDAGGSGGGGRSAGANLAGRHFPKPKSTALEGLEEEISDRRPAGLEADGEISTQAVDIWQVISVSFRKHCAQGRLMDCADHLPK